jgi:hypothetical protein
VLGAARGDKLLVMPSPLPILVLLALAQAREPAWWEGRWGGEGTSCDATARDARPFVLGRSRLEFIESACIGVKEGRASSTELTLHARCRDHGERTWRPRSFVLQPSDGGRVMVLQMGSGQWRLRKCT